MFTGSSSSSSSGSGSGSTPVSFNWKSYWSYQERRWRHYDKLSCLAKLLLLFLNFTKPLNAAPEHHQLRIWTQASAGVAFIIVAATLWLMQTQPEVYRKLYRRQLLMLHWGAIAVVIAVSFPMLMSAKTTSQSAVVRIIPFLFKTGAMAPVVGALMNRLPWQHVLCMSSLFGALLSVVWVQPFCLQLTDPQDVALVSRLAAGLDHLCGFGHHVGGAGYTGHTRTAAGHAAGSTIEVLTWKSTAGSIAAACVTAAGSNRSGASGASSSNVNGSSSSSRHYPGGGEAVALSLQPPLSSAATDLEVHCKQLTLGQCVAVVNTVNLWVGVLMVVFVVLLVERNSKWQYLHQQHTDSSRVLQAMAPNAYKQESRKRFLRMQLLQLHVLLDLPLLLLWLWFTKLHRPGSAADLAL